MSLLSRYGIIYLCAAIGPLAGNAILSMLHELQTSLHATLPEIYLSIPAFMFPFAFLQLFSGSLSDKWGRKIVLISGLLIYAFSSLGIALIDNLFGFLTLRIAQGVGNAFIAPVSLAMLGDISDKNRYGVAMGFYGSFTTAGIAIGPLVAGFLTEIDWRLTFYLFFALALTSSLLVIVMKYPQVRPKAFSSVVANMRLALKHRILIIVSIIGALGFFAGIGNISFLSDYLRTEPSLGFGAADVGLVISVSGFMGIFASPIAGKVTDRCSPRLSTMLGISIVIPSVFLTAFAGEFYQFLTLSIFTGLGMSFMWTGLLTQTVGEMPALRGTASSLFNGSRFSGYAISPILLTPIYLTASYFGIAMVCSAILAVAGLISILLPQKKCKGSSGSIAP
ncbi:MAG: MFS transporter [Thermoplasmata archaeon]